MDTVSLELPAELVRLAQRDTGDLSQETAKILAPDLFRERKVSLGRWNTTGIRLPSCGE
jgi:hypothetical protein